MSMSTPGGAPERVPSTVSTDKKPAGGAKPPAGKPGGTKPGAGRPGAGKGGKGRKPIAAVKVNQGTNWGPMLVIGAVVLLAVGIIGYGVYAVSNSTADDPWETQAAGIDGIINYRETQPDLVKAAQHQLGPVAYTITPPVAGVHNPAWMNCMGEIYDAPVAPEHAVHSLEHGAVWVTYKLGTAPELVKTLGEKIAGKPFTLMSPVEGLDANVSLQAWGYQLKVDTVTDPRIDAFIKALRINASVEPGVACSGGTSTTGPVAPAPAAQPTGS
jgi:hypothetical protein